MSIRVTANDIIGFIAALSPDEEERLFTKLISETMTAEGLLVLLNKLPETEQERFSDLVADKLFDVYFPVMIEQAFRFTREHPEGGRGEYWKWVLDRAAEEKGRFAAAHQALGRAKRKYGSKPEVIRSCVNICDLRREDRQTYTVPKLASMFHKAEDTIKEILAKESEWRQKLRDLENKG
jgi:hypothetical protein